MTNDYISREYLLAEYDRQHQGPPGGARKIIAEAPAADVVEVVRCRDCKHYDCEDGDQKCVKDAEWDEETACYYGFIAYHGPEFFCADGERK